MKTSLTLYEIADQYLADVEKLKDLDLDDQTISDTLESLTGDMEGKCTNVAAFVRNLEASAAAIKQAEEQMASRRKAIEKRAEQITEYLLANMQRTGISKIESPWFKIALQNNPPSLVIDDPGKIPGELYIYPDPPPPSPDKSAIKAALKAGQEVPGVHLEVKQRVVIK